MDRKQMILDLLDEIGYPKEAADCINKYTILEKYSKKIEEDTRDNTIGRCLDIVENSKAYDGVKRIIINRIKKL